MVQTSGNEPQVTMRVNRDQKAIVELGAKAWSLSVTDFIMTLAIRDADAAIAERALFVLDEDNFNKFLEILNRPPLDKPELRRLFSKNKSNK